MNRTGKRSDPQDLEEQSEILTNLKRFVFRMITLRGYWLSRMLSLVDNLQCRISLRIDEEAVGTVWYFVAVAVGIQPEEYETKSVRYASEGMNKPVSRLVRHADCSLISGASVCARLVFFLPVEMLCAGKAQSP